MSVDVKRMSEKTDISIERIKLALGLETEVECDVSHLTTAKEAKQALEDPLSRNKQALVMRKWQELSAEEVVRISTREQAKEAFGDTPDYSEVEVQAMRRWIELCSTAEEAKSAYNETSDGREEEDLAIQGLSVFFPVMVSD
jgi:hypothetical protein